MHFPLDPCFHSASHCSCSSDLSYSVGSGAAAYSVGSDVACSVGSDSVGSVDCEPVTVARVCWFGLASDLAFLAGPSCSYL